MRLVERTVGFKPGERNIFFHILTGCNLACKHCYINKEQHGTAMLSLATIKQWLHLFADENKKTNCIFLGGEPTLHPELAAAIADAKALGYFVTVDSNGYLFHDLLKKTTPDKLDFLSFSLDGPNAAINDPIRGSGVFEICTTNLLQARQAGFNVSVIYTVSRANIDYLEAMVDLLVQLQVKKFFIQVIGLRGNSSKTEGIDSPQVSREQWLSVVPKVAAKAAKMGIHVTYPKVFLGDDEEFECAGVVAENYFIFPNGRVYQCPLCEDHPIHSFNIIEDKLVRNGALTEANFFQLNIPEGCVMNKLLQPDTIEYDSDGGVKHRISCCLLKQEIG